MLHGFASLPFEATNVRGAVAADSPTKTHIEHTMDNNVRIRGTSVDS
jgi:hypothetical protein